MANEAPATAWQSGHPALLAKGLTACVERDRASGRARVVVGDFDAADSDEVLLDVAALALASWFSAGGGTPGLPGAPAGLDEGFCVVWVDEDSAPAH